jgi:hypothetical protein
MLEISFEQALSPELEIPLRLQDLGSPDWSVKNPFASLRAYIADEPISFSLKEMHRVLAQPIPRSLDFYRGYEVWLIPNRFSVKKEGGISEPSSLGIQIEFRNDDNDVNLNPGMTCSVIALLPEARFFQRGFFTGALSGAFTPTGEISLNTESFVPKESLPLSTDLKVGLNADVKVGLSFNYQVHTPVISAIGIGSSRAEWMFSEESGPLYGKDIETWTVLAVPKGLADLHYRVKLYVNLRTAYIPTRHETAWKTLKISLKKISRRSLVASKKSAEPTLQPTK